MPKQNQAPAKNSETPSFEVVVSSLTHVNGSKLRGYADLRFGDFVIHGFRLYEGENGLFAASPQVSWKDEEGTLHYRDIFHGVSREANQLLEQVFVSAYEEAVQQQELNELYETALAKQTMA